MTHIIVPIFGDSIDGIREDIAAAIELGATMIELRLDRMPDVFDEELRALCEKHPAEVPILLTYRSAAEGGDDSATDESRLERLDALGPVANLVDIEWSTFSQSARNQKLIESAIHRAGVASHSGGVEVIEQASRRSLILSKHDQKGRPAGLQGDLLRMANIRICDVVKLAWRARSVRDNFEAFELLRISPKPAICVCMGDDGMISRILAKKFRAFGTFASLRSGLESAPGQISLNELRDRYRWDFINERTQVYGLIGDPVVHSLSADVHNAVHAEQSRNAVYVPFRVNAGHESFKAFMVEVLARPWLDIAGFSVTIPHKENAYRYLKEQGADLDEMAKKCGAVNTIQVFPDGRLVGWNTDCEAFCVALQDAISNGGTLANAKVLLLGAGGAARAAVVGLQSRGANLVIANRTDEKAASLGGEFGVECIAWEERTQAKPNIVVNCTPVGMWPAVDETPMPLEGLPQSAVVFDMVYNPLETKLLREAKERGCRTIDGLSMFTHQAAAQIGNWTGQTPAAEGIRAVAERALSMRVPPDLRSG